MRTKLNLDSSSNRRATDSDRRVMDSNHRATDSDRRVMDKVAMSGVPLAGMPLEWLDAGSWRLPSGKALAEFALQAGFLAPPIFNGEKVGAEAPRARVRRFMSDGVLPSEIKPCGKGSGQ